MEDIFLQFKALKFLDYLFGVVYLSIALLLIEDIHTAYT